MTGDSWYYIGTSDWPVTTVENELSSEEVLDVLDQMSTYYNGAVASLAETIVPGTADGRGNQPPYGS